MNLSPLWEGFLISNGFKAIHWSKIGDARAPDTEIFEYAARTQSIIFTNDLDFGTILSKNKTRLPGIIQIRMLDINFEKVGAILVQC